MAKSLDLNISQWFSSRTLKVTSVSGLVMIAIALVVLAQNYFKYAAITVDYSLKLSLVYNLIVYGSFSLLTPIILKVSDQIPIRAYKYKSFLAHIGVSLLLACIHMFLCNLLLYSIGLSSSPVFPRFIVKYLTNVAHVNVIVYWAIVLLLTFYRDLYRSKNKESNDQIERFTIKENGRIFFIDFHEVYWIEAHDHYQKLHTQSGYYLIKDSMKNLESTLPETTFQRAHRSYFVNTNHIQSLLKSTNDRPGAWLELSNGASLKLGRAYQSKFRV